MQRSLLNKCILSVWSFSSPISYFVYLVCVQLTTDSDIRQIILEFSFCFTDFCDLVPAFSEVREHPADAETLDLPHSTLLYYGYWSSCHQWQCFEYRIWICAMPNENGNVRAECRHNAMRRFRLTVHTTQSYLTSFKSNVTVWEFSGNINKIQKYITTKIVIHIFIYSV